MSNYVVVNNVEHKETRIDTRRNEALGDRVMSVVTFPFEFRNIQSAYPILFQNAGDEVAPVALFGFEQGENLFLEEDGWQANYVPAMLRREPFMINYQEQEGSDEPVRFVALDMDHPRVNSEQGELLFEDLGNRTPFLDDIVQLLEAMYEGIEHSKKFVAALNQYELLENINMQITLDDGSQHQLLGFLAINEEKVQELPGTVLEEFNRRGFLLPMFMVLASMVNMQTLVDMKNKRMEQQVHVSLF